MSAGAAANVAVGVFDGVHRGHQHLLGAMVEASRRDGRTAICITLDPDPEAVLHPEQPWAALCRVEERLERLRALELDSVEILSFDARVARQSADEFVDWLIARYPVAGLWGGLDFALGRERSGTIDALRALGSARGFQVVSIDRLEEEGHPISATRIRQLLRAGEVELAARLLGRPYTLSGEVAHGAERGRLLGFPTANVVPTDGLVLPADGVYFVGAQGEGLRTFGVANLGSRPTFEEHERLLETHLLDFSGDLYGATLVVSFLSQLRPTRKFGSVDELAAQITRDVEAARALMGQAADPAVEGRWARFPDL